MKTRPCLAGLLLLSSVAALRAQNIPPLVGGPGKPGWKFPNPLEKTEPGRGKDSSRQPSSRQTTDSQNSATTGERDILRVLESWRSGFARKDLTALGSLYSQTEDLRVYWEGREFSGWRALKGKLERVLASPEGLQMELRDPEVHSFGRFAWILARYESRHWVGGAPRQREGHLTLLLEQRRTFWTIVHQHASATLGTVDLNLTSQ